jgi:hypothetical protein
MVLPIELGPDPVVYGLSLAAITIAFMKLGLNDWKFPSITPDEAEDAESYSYYRPIKYTAFWAMQLFTLLLHGAILAGLIVMYSGTLRNSKDNVILVLSAIALGLNLLDFLFKSYMGMFYVTSDVISEGVQKTERANFFYDAIYNMDSEPVGKPRISLYTFKWTMFFFQVFGLCAFFITSFAYAWVGDMASFESNSRSMLTVSGLGLVCIFGIAMGLLYKRSGLVADTTDKLMAAAGLKFTVTPTSVDAKVYHAPVQVAGIAEPLKHSDPHTAMLMAASAKAGQGLKPGITASSWNVVRHGKDNYLVSPEVFKVHQDLMRTVWGGLAENNTTHTGGHQEFVETLNHVSNSIHSGSGFKERISNIILGVKRTGKAAVLGHKVGFGTSDYPAYTLIIKHVAGFGRGMGVFFNTHPWMPIVSLFYMFGFYLVMLQNTESALLAVSICHIPAVVMCFFGIVQQWWELFRWNFLVGWSLINLVPYVIPTETSRYVRDAASWNITNFPVQAFPTYTNYDNSTTVLGYNAFSTTTTLAVLVGVIIALATSASGKASATVVNAKSEDTEPLVAGSSSMALSTNGLSNRKERSVRYLNQ